MNALIKFKRQITCLRYFVCCALRLASSYAALVLDSWGISHDALRSLLLTFYMCCGRINCHA